MPENEVLAFPDKNVPPTDDIIAERIGDKKKLWDHILHSLKNNYKDISWSWNYYNDGHQWLFKLVQKKKTVLWGTVLEKGDFKMTSYFGDKAEETILASELPSKVKNDFMDGPRYGKIRAITMHVKNEKDAATVLQVADLKIKMK